VSTALVPGSLDPITNGHVDIIERAARLFDQVLVVIFPNPGKHSTLFTLDERLDMTRAVLSGLSNVRVDADDGLLIRYARRQGVKVIVKGLRAVSDFEYEFQMAQMNRDLSEETETLFMISRPEHTYLSSSIVKELASYGADIGALVPPIVAARLREKFAPSATHEYPADAGRAIDHHCEGQGSQCRKTSGFTSTR